jgi:shikimate dehydrogenase
VKPARLAVIGLPVAHSASPAMHQAALDLRGIAARYVKLELEPGQVAEAFARMRDLGFLGCNVTVPHKFEALEACDTVDPAAADLGAVNTVRFDAAGCHGSNTDGPGFVRAIREEFLVDVRDLRILILGAGGGAGGAIATQCAREGCEELVLVNRSFEKLAALSARLAPRFRNDRLAGPRDRLRALALDDPRLREAVAGCDLVVNCSSLGLRRGDPSPLPEGCLEPHHLVYDTIYNPPRTALLRAAGQAGARAANGTSMLLYQGALAFEIWFEGDAPLAAMRAALKASPA